MFEPETQPGQEGREEEYSAPSGAEGRGRLLQIGGYRQAAAGQAANLRWLKTDFKGKSTDTAASHYLRSELQKITAEKSRLLDNMVNLRSELLLHQECELRIAQLITRLSETRSHSNFRSGMLLQVVEDINNTRMDGGPTGLSLLAVNFGKRMCGAWEGNCWEMMFPQLLGPNPSQAISTMFYHNATNVSSFSSSATEQAVLFPITAGKAAGKAATLAQLQQLGWTGLEVIMQEYRERFTFLLEEVRSPSVERVAAAKQEAEQLMIEMGNLLIVHKMGRALSSVMTYAPDPVHELVPFIRQAMAAAGLSQAQVEMFGIVHRQHQGILKALDRRVGELKGKVQTLLQNLGGCLGEATKKTDAYKTLLDTAMQLKHTILERNLADMVASCTFYFRHISPFQMAVLWARLYPFSPRMEYLQLALESA